MEVINFSKGTQVFGQGTYGEEAYRILEGSVEISIKEDGSKVVLAKLGPGEIFGEMGMIERRPRSATAYALGKLRVEVITEDDFNALLSQGGKALVPYRISRNHCAIERKDGAFFVVDRGSMLGTIVNGICIGADSREKSTRLSPGRNSLVLGGLDSSIRFIVTVPDSV